MDWLLDLGYLGLFIGSFLASTIIPFSSDFLLVAMLAAGGNPVYTVICASLGNWAGGMTSYYLGYIGKWEWIEKWFKIKPETLAKQKTKIEKYGEWIALFSWLPGIGDVMSVGLGFYKVNPWRVAIFMLIGKTARFVGWAMLYTWAQPWMIEHGWIEG